MTSTSSSDETAELLRQTRRHFPDLETETIEITPIEKGGSDRKFYRVRSSPDYSIIVITYSLAREENRHYVAIAEFLAAHGIRAPKVYCHDASERLIWIEDLGAADLWSYRKADWAARRNLYVSALTEAAKLHALPSTVVDGIRSDLQPAFDAPLYLWEQQYFFDNCLGHRFGVDEKVRAELAALPVLRETATRLADLPRVLVHRDLQSQNILIRDGHAHLIDFQGMRLGLADYDIASLLYDPYVELFAPERTELFTCYETIRARTSDNEELLRLCAMQRVMQALGAYGYLGLVKGNASFLAHIPAALASLRSIVAQIEGAEKLSETLQGLPAAPR